MKRSIILVGNGISLLDRQNGHLIDNFENVVRFNLYQIQGYESFTGIRTTTWFTGAGVLPTDWRFKEQYQQVISFSWQWDKNKCDLYKLYSKYFNNVEKIERNNIIEIQQYMNDSSYFTYSSGAICAWKILKEYDNITLTGFDWWDSRDKHHYCDDYPRGDVHQPAIEKKFFDKLFNDRRIFFL